MRIVIVAAVGSNGVIGVGGRLPWRIPEDLARFKKLTIGQTLIMGRETFESIGRPLPGRSTIVLTRRSDWSAPGVETSGSLEDALSMADKLGKDAFVSGGAEVYRQALKVADAMELTEVEAEPEGDTYFPEVEWDDWSVVSRVAHPGFVFVTYTRV